MGRSEPEPGRIFLTVVPQDHSEGAQSHNAGSEQVQSLVHSRTVAIPSYKVAVSKIIQPTNSSKQVQSEMLGENFFLVRKPCSVVALSAAFTTHKEPRSAPSWLASGNGQAELGSCTGTLAACS